MAYIESKGGLTLQDKGPSGISLYPYPSTRAFTPSSGYDGMSKLTIPSYNPPLYDYLFTKKNVETIFSDGEFKNGYDFGVYLYYRGSSGNSVAIENGLIHIHQKYNSSEYAGFCLNKKTNITSASRLLVLASSRGTSETGQEAITNRMNWIGLASACAGDKSWQYMDNQNANFTPIKTGQSDVSTMCESYRNASTGYYTYDSMDMQLFDVPLLQYRDQLNSSVTDTSLYIYMGGHDYSKQGDYYIKYIGIIGDNGGATGTQITPSNSSPVALASGSSYEMLGNGHAIQSYNTKTVPSSITGTPVAVTNGEIDKIAGNNGYLIHSYGSITPSTNGVYFGSGMRKMSSSGYAYSGLVQLKPTVVWTNPSLSSGGSNTEFAGQDVTLTSPINAKGVYIGVKWKWMYTSDGYDTIDIWSIDDFTDFTPSNTAAEGFFGLYYTGSSPGRWYLRNVSYVDSTHIHFSNCWNMKLSASAYNSKYNQRIIPAYVYMYQVSA